MRAGCFDMMQKKDLPDRKQEKAQLRKQILKARNALSREQRLLWDRQIFDNLVNYDMENPCSAYLCYVNYKSEVSTREFICWCLRQGKMIFVPKVIEDKSVDAESRFVPTMKSKRRPTDFVKVKVKPAEMEFYQINAWEELKAGYQGIPEPEALRERAFSRWLTGIERDRWISPAGSSSDRTAETGEKKKPLIRILLPGAVFDKKGNRIGYGGGFYDRWLAKPEIETACFDGKLEIIGLAYGMQIVEAVPAEDFDQKADRVITEKLRVLRYNGCWERKMI